MLFYYCSRRHTGTGIRFAAAFPGAEARAEETLHKKMLLTRGIKKRRRNAGHRRPGGIYADRGRQSWPFERRFSISSFLFCFICCGSLCSTAPAMDVSERTTASMDKAACCCTYFRLPSVRLFFCEFDDSVIYDPHASQGGRRFGDRFRDRYLGTFLMCESLG